MYIGFRLHVSLILVGPDAHIPNSLYQSYSAAMHTRHLHKRELSYREVSSLNLLLVGPYLHCIHEPIFVILLANGQKEEI